MVRVAVIVAIEVEWETIPSYRMILSDPSL